MMPANNVNVETLVQQAYNGAPTDLPGYRQVMNSGPMGCCDTVLVLTRIPGGGPFTTVRGYHAGGGIQGAQNLQDVFAGVANNANDTRIVVLGGEENRSPYARQLIRDVVNGAKLLAGLNNVPARYEFEVAEGQVDRQGLLIMRQTDPVTGMLAPRQVNL